MAKKKAAKRSAKKGAPKKRKIVNNMPPPRPPFVDVSNYADAGDQTAQQIAASRTRLSAAVASGETAPVPPIPGAGTAPVHVALEGRASAGLRSGSDMGVQSGFSGAETVTRAAVPVVPTVYPESPNGKTVIVQNFVTINIHSKEFRELDARLEAVFDALRGNNDLSPEVKGQLLAELKAGRQILEAPKPERNLVDLLLVRPLQWAAEKAGSVAFGDLAKRALDFLLGLIS
jgi:hypothetical protein